MKSRVFSAFYPVSNLGLHCSGQNGCSDLSRRARIAKSAICTSIVYGHYTGSSHRRMQWMNGGLADLFAITAASTQGYFSRTFSQNIPSLGRELTDRIRGACHNDKDRTRLSLLVISRLRDNVPTRVQQKDHVERRRRTTWNITGLRKLEGRW
jgi:hypothetical protein